MILLLVIIITSAGGIPKEFVMFGEEKSSISLLSTIPLGVITLEPNKVFTVLSMGGVNNSN